MKGKQPSGWVTFASIMMFGMGGFALLAAIADFVNPAWILDRSILGNTLDFLWYGILDLVIAIGAVYAGYAMLRGQKAGFWLGVIFASLGALRWFLFVPGMPIWGLTMTLVWILVIYGLAESEDYFGIDLYGEN